MRKSGTVSRLTIHSLKVLREQGFRFVLVNGYTPERKFDHITLTSFILVPVMELPGEPGQKGIYAPIDSDILDDWASESGNGINAFIEGDCGK